MKIESSNMSFVFLANCSCCEGHELVQLKCGLGSCCVILSKNVCYNVQKKLHGQNSVFNPPYVILQNSADGVWKNT